MCVVVYRKNFNINEILAPSCPKESFSHLLCCLFMLKHGVPGASLDIDLNIKEELSPFFVSPSSTQLNNHFYIPQAVASNSGVKKTENHHSNITVFCLSPF